MINDPTPNLKDVVILQRDDTNSQYNETHISGSDVIIYIDSAGYINADKSASFYTIFPPPPSTSQSDSASWASHSFSAESSSWTSRSFSAESASWASQSLSSSFVGFNGNRNIKRSGYIGLNVGGIDVVDFLDNFFFPFIPATVAISSGGTSYYETGSVQSFVINSTITANDEVIYGTGSIKRDGLDWNTVGSIPPLSFIYTDTNISTSYSYVTYVQTDNNGSSMVIGSNTKASSFIFPYLWGMSTTPGLSGNALYTTFTKQVVIQSNKTINLVGNTTYIYFCYPDSYPDLTSILDPNLFQVISSFQYSASVPVTSSGLTNNWMANYKVYRTTLIADPTGFFQFIY